MNISSFLKECEQFLKKENIILDKREIEGYATDRTKDFLPDASAVLFPRTTEEVRNIILLANQYQVPLVPSGGRTGYSGGAVAFQKEVIISLSKMNQILYFDATLPAVTLEAGVITKHLQQFAEEKGFYFPVDFSSSYSSQVGGNIATNAGGIRVIRYGSLRNWLIGLEVITGKGDRLYFQGNLLKNNTGYDMKQLFIGSEGTLGIITQATFLLTQKPEDSIVFLIAFPEFKEVLECLQLTKQYIKKILCYETFDSSSLSLVCKKHQLRHPFPHLKEQNCWYVLIEAEQEQSQSEIHYESFLEALYSLSLLDASYTTTESGKKNFFRYREDISEAIAMSGKFHKNDISLPIKKLDNFIKKINNIVDFHFSEFQLFLFGHVGDGNIHINLLADREYPEELFRNQIKEFDLKLYSLIQEFGGSISAEHGIGLLKKPYLHFSRSSEEIQYMKQIKNIFDPNHILNPGKIFE